MTTYTDFDLQQLFEMFVENGFTEEDAMRAVHIASSWYSELVEEALLEE